MKYLLAFFALAMCAAAAALDPAADGVWYEPDFPGHGLIVETWPENESGNGLAFYYGYDLDGNQRWFMTGNFSEGVNRVPLYEPTGIFPNFEFEVGEPIGEADIAYNPASDTLSMEFTIVYDLSGCTGRPVSLAVPFCFGEFLFERLTEADGVVE